MKGEEGLIEMKIANHLYSMSLGKVSRVGTVSSNTSPFRRSPAQSMKSMGWLMMLVGGSWPGNDLKERLREAV